MWAFLNCFKNTEKINKTQWSTECFWHPYSFACCFSSAPLDLTFASTSLVFRQVPASAISQPSPTLPGATNGVARRLPYPSATSQEWGEQPAAGWLLLCHAEHCQLHSWCTERMEWTSGEALYFNLLVLYRSWLKLYIKPQLELGHLW